MIGAFSRRHYDDVKPHTAASGVREIPDGYRCESDFTGTAAGAIDRCGAAVAFYVEQVMLA